MSVPCVGVVGWSNSGKTMFLERLVPELCARGVRVAVLKHSDHLHPLHKPGSDTERLEHSGAALVGFATPAGLQLTLPGEGLSHLALLRERLVGLVELLLVEGGKEAPWPKLEVWRAGLGPMLAPGRADILAVVSEDRVPAGVRCLRPAALPELAELVLGAAEGRVLP